MNKNLRNTWLMLLGGIALTACPSPPPPPPTVVIPETTKVVTGTTQTALETVQPNTLTFNGTQSFKTGDVVVSAPTASAPDGFLRKVISSQTQNGKTVLTTAPATLREAIQKGKLQETRDLTSADIESTELVAGVRLRPQARPNNPTFDFSKVLFDKDDKPETKDDQVVLSGYLDLKPSVRFDWDFGFFDFDFLAEAKFVEQTGLSLKGKVSYSFNKSLEVGRVRFRPITFSIGPIPVVIRPVVTLTIGVRGSASGEVDVFVNQTLTITAGAKYDEEWTNLSDISNSFDVEKSTIKAAINAEAYANVKLELLLYESVGLFVRPEVFVAFDAQFPRKPFWKLGGGLAVDIGISIDIWGIDKEYDTRILERRFPIASSPNSPPEITNFGVSPTGDLNRPISLFGLATDLEDGANLTYTWTSSNPADGTIPTGNSTFKTFTTIGTRTITLTVRDSDGETKTSSTSINITNSPPNVVISEPNENSVIYQSLTYDFLASAADINEVAEAVPCANIVWTSSNLADTLGTGCQVSATFSSTGNRTITVRATDSQGLQNSKTANINVLPTPANLPPVLAKINNPTTSTEIGNGIITLAAQTTTDPEGGAVTYRWYAEIQPGAGGNFTNKKELVPNAQNQVNLVSVFALTCGPSGFNVNIRITLEVSDPQGNKRSTSVIPKNWICIG
jgi:hypothetical protein